LRNLLFSERGGSPQDETRVTHLQQDSEEVQLLFYDYRGVYEELSGFIPKERSCLQRATRF
jgi:hypothetical protein